MIEDNRCKNRNFIRNIAVNTLSFIIKSYNKWLLSRRIKNIDNTYYALIDNTSILTKKELNQINEFYKKYVNIRWYSHAFYKEKTGIFDPLYIPDSIFNNYVDRYFNNWDIANYLDNKCYYLRMFNKVNQPKMVTYRTNNYWYNSDGIIIDFNNAVELVFSNQSDCFIKKAINSFGGKGVYYFDTANKTKSDFINIINSIEGDIVIQEKIVQHPILAKLNEDSCNSVRVLSMLNSDGSVKIYSSILRMGLKGSKVDNASSGGISVGILSDGKLKDIAYTNKGEKFTKHPSSHVIFSDYSVPSYSKIIDLIKNIHPEFPYFRLISWDWAIDSNEEPVFIEANLCDGELDFHQLNNGPVFGKDTETILNEVFATKNI